MIDLQMWRAVIGCFTQPKSKKCCVQTEEGTKYNMRGVLTATLLLSLSLWYVNTIVIVSSETPYVDLLFLSGDVEVNPGPTDLETVLSELRAFRTENERQLGDLKKEVTSMREEMKQVKEEVEVMKKCSYTQQVDIDKNKSGVDKLNDRMENMEGQMEKYERYSRRDNVLLYGLRENEGENTKAKFVELMNKEV